ncbi:hypothetical protein EVAR_10314_1 [Eumeta japonica]|uniref:Uncharacterized protein n=1 Tax=Eumeta variegata TaxID=151549 RepID=A0A4C1TEN3_EUMVA|nr:hypothetical protein EVAR_10314_1 [Eumeta japonica]
MRRTSEVLDKFLDTSSASTSSQYSDKENIVASELALTYHTVKHNLSYNSMDCTVKLNKIIYADSSTATAIRLARTKMEVLVTEVDSIQIDNTQNDNETETTQDENTENETTQNVNTLNRVATHSVQKKRRQHFDVEDAQKKLNLSFQTLNNVLSKNNAEDECDIYGKLLATKLWKYPESIRQKIMNKIDGFLLENPPHTANIKYHSLTPSSGHTIPPSPSYVIAQSPGHTIPPSPVTISIP